jgi:hypothetical protein
VHLDDLLRCGRKGRPSGGSPRRRGRVCLFTDLAVAADGAGCIDQMVADQLRLPNPPSAQPLAYRQESRGLPRPSLHQEASGWLNSATLDASGKA